MTDVQHDRSKATVGDTRNDVTLRENNGYTRKAGSKKTMLQTAIVIVVAIAVGAGGWLWWTRPSTTRVSLPAGVEGGETVPLASSLPPPQTRTGTLEYDSLRSERHQWIASVHWTPTGGKPTVYELHLGESVHIDGLGTVTLLAVNPPPLLSGQKPGGWTIEVNINLNPDLHWCEPWDPC